MFLENNEYNIIIVDNLANSKIERLYDIIKISCRKVKYYEYDLLDINYYINEDYFI